MIRRVSQRGHCRESGAALVIALLLIALLGIIVVELSHSVSVDARAVLNAGINAQNMNAALGGVQLAMAVLAGKESEEDGSDSLDEDWAKERRVEIGKAEVTVRLVDEASKLNINRLTASGPDDENELDRLAQALGLKVNEIGAKAQDWTDSDDEGPFEDHAPNRSFLCPAELMRLKGIDSEALYGENGLGPYVTVWSDGKVNLNTAPRQVLQAILPEEEWDMADAIIARRKQKPFAKVGELQMISGMSGSVFSRLRERTCAASSVFAVESTSAMGRMRRTVLAVLRRDDDGVRMIYFEESPPPGELSTARGGETD